MRLLYIASRENAEDEGGQSTKIQTVKFYYSYATYDLPKLFICKEPVGLLCRRANETLCCYQIETDKGKLTAVAS